jgi:uncharacterized protein
MSTYPYDYSERRGILPVSWNDVHGLCKALAKAVAPYAPESILAVGRGGFYPGTLLSHMLQVEVYPVRLSRRVNDIVTYEHPRWIVRPTQDAVADKRVLVVDEISSSGETLRTVTTEAESMGASEVRCAVLYAHSWGAHVPDYIGLVSDALILNPWDREILKNGEFVFHPEYVGALAAQGLEPSDDLRIAATEYKVEKG